ncbi:MAG: enoyl-ACP reductase FabI [Propionibacteriaceae bacterium]|nr:enoyl-ACP reductase FabI [Propionibacteriaceae bacterium]
MGILEGKNLLVTGVTSHTSIAFAVAQVALAEGANVIVSNLGRALPLTTRVVRKLNPTPAVIELDVTDTAMLEALPDVLRSHGFTQVDGVVHSIAFANPERALGGAFLNTAWQDVSTSLHTSAYSLKSLVMAVKPLLVPGSAVVGLTYDSAVTWPDYDWMGVSKAALEATSRYLARYLGPDGIRCNLVSAGPVDTIAKMAIPGAHDWDELWSKRAPLGWNPKDATPVARAVTALLSDWFPATTGEIIFVDGGFHSTGA